MNFASDVEADALNERMFDGQVFRMSAECWPRQDGFVNSGGPSPART